MNQPPIVCRGTRIVSGDTVLTVSRILRSGVECTLKDHTTIVVDHKAIEMAATN